MKDEWGGGRSEHVINKANILPVQGSFSFDCIISYTFHFGKNFNYIMARKKIKDIKETHD